MGDKPVGMGFYVMSDGTQQMLTELSLQPHETRAISLRKLRDTQRADFKGRKISATATDGTVTWARTGNQPVAGRVVVINRYNGTASNYDCCNCPCPMWYYDGNMYAWPSFLTVAVGGIASIEALADFYDCNGNGPYTFNVASDTDPPYDCAVWSTQNSSVATVSYGGVTGVNFGTTTILVDYTGCTNWATADSICYCSSTCETQSPVTVATTPYCVITATSVDPTTIHTNSGPNTATVSVQIYHQSLPTNDNESVVLEVGTGSTNPATGVSVSYDPVNQPVALSGGAGSVTATVVVASPSCPSSSSPCTVTIQASLANNSSGIAINNPTPPSNAQATLTVANP